MSSGPAAPGSPRIFISYRRDDTSAHAGRLYDALAARFGADRLFIDIDTIPVGADFAEALQEAIDSADVVLVLIGRSWLTASDKTGAPRLQDPNDFVRLEVEAALERKARILPVLVQNADMPTTDDLPDSLSGLVRRQAFELADRRWRSDLTGLVSALERLAEQSRREAEERSRREAEERSRREATERSRLGVEERSRRDAAERSRREVAERSRPQRAEPSAWFEAVRRTLAERGKSLLVPGVLVVAIAGFVLFAVRSRPSPEPTSPARPEGTAGTATIGFVGALSGDNSNLGKDMLDAAKIAVAEENAKGGLKVNLVEFDTAGDPAQALAIQDRYIGDSSVIGIVGPGFSGEAKAIIPSLQRAGLVFISPSATNTALPTVEPNGSVFHRVIADDLLQPKGIVAYLAGLDPVPTAIAYVHDGTEYGTFLADGVETGATARGLRKAVSASLDPRTQDFAETVATVKRANPSHIVFGGYASEAGRLKRQLTEAAVNGQFISGDGALDPLFVAAAGPQAAEGARLVCPCNLGLDSSTGPLKAFYDRFKSDTGRDPGLYAPEAYDATKILIQGIKTGNTDRESLVDYVEGLGAYDGISKRIEFEPNGNLRLRALFVFQVTNGRVTPLQQVDVT